jgi:hypothetical protein
MAQNPSDKTCFIAMPVTTTEAHAELFGDPEHWIHVLETLFVPAVEAAGFEALRPVATGSHMIHAEIVRQLERADMVLCDLSTNNPNVFFELGVRTSVNKPVALVRCDPKTPIPFDVSGINTHTYNPALKAWANPKEIEALTAHLQKAELSCGGDNPLWRQFGMTLKALAPSSDQTQEEAMFSVVLQQIEALSEQVDGLGNRRQPRSFDTLRAERTVDDRRLLDELDALADKHQVDSRIAIESDGAVLLVLDGPKSDRDLLYLNEARNMAASLGRVMQIRSTRDEIRSKKD